ncbi:MAG TPA: ATP-binding protein [Acidimicrobiales bacterium]|jgi:serine/threonine-protein kinase RsbW
MSDTVELTIPIRSDLLILARLTAAAMAARAEFGIEDIEDLRLVVEELCISVIGSMTNGTLHLRFSEEDGAITVGCSVSGEGDDDAPGESEPDELSLRIIEALVDEYGEDSVGGRRQAWIRKHRSKVAS